MSNGGHNPYDPRQHAVPQDNATVTCLMCGGEMVRHIATQDKWLPVTTEHGIRWLCTKDVCREEARKQGIPAPPIARI